MRSTLLFLVCLTGCAVAHEPLQEFTANEQELMLAPLGGHLPGISDDDFSEVSGVFAAVETPEDGVGPIFNKDSCGGCHVLGTLGGAGEHRVNRFGYYGNGAFNPLANLGGSLRQSETLGEWVNAQGKQCSVPLEAEPAAANVKGVRRLTTPLFGLGLVDAMPDQFFVELAKRQPASVRGTVNWVNVVLPDPKDPTQSVGSARVGRFGWKAGVPGLVQFSADAYLNEMGITTQSCFNGKSIDAFAAEPAPNGVPVSPECEDGLPGVDDAVGPCENLTEIQEDVEEFAEFMTFLAPPAQVRVKDRRSIDQCSSGKQLFERVGCADCHTNYAFVTPRHPFNGVPGKYSFYPYSDFLVHDMGSLGDQIGNLGDPFTTTRRMRTAPLWGLRYRTLLLHDGRATNVDEAILAHEGQAHNSSVQYSKLSKQQRQQLVEFVNSL